VFYEDFEAKWAVGDESGYLVVNPKSYRLKPWMAFNIVGRAG
jgi:hypothetical protein